MPGTDVRTARSSAATAARNASGLSTASMACASRGPTPLAVCSSSKVLRSSSVANPYRVSESSRTTRDVATRAGSPTRSRANVAGVHWTSKPTPPTSMTAPSGATAATHPVRWEIIGLLRRVGKPEQSHNHLSDLCLACGAASSHSGLDLARRMHGHRHAAPGSADDRDGTGLGGAHDRPDILLAEDTLDGHSVRLVLDQPPVQLDLERK